MNPSALTGAGEEDTSFDPQPVQVQLDTQTQTMIAASTFRAAAARLTFCVALALYALLQVCTALWTLVGTQRELLAQRASFLI